VIDAKHHQAGVGIVTNFLTGLREWVNTIKVSTLPRIRSHARFNLFRYLLRFSNELLGSVFRDFCDRRLSRKPVAGTVLIQVGCCCSQPGVVHRQTLLETHRA
jgi:hypothetical protein